MATRPTSRERELKNDIARLEELEQSCAARGAMAAAVKARVEVDRLRERLSRLRQERLAERTGDDLTRLRALRRAAVEAGSWVAVDRLLRQEREVEKERARVMAEQAEAERAEMSDAALLLELDELIGGLPQAAVDQLAEMVERQRRTPG